MVPIVFQVLFNACMVNATNEVRANLTFKMGNRTISSARHNERPKTPVLFDVLIDRLDNNYYPPKFQKLYLGRTLMRIGRE